MSHKFRLLYPLFAIVAYTCIGYQNHPPLLVIIIVSVRTMRNDRQQSENLEQIKTATEQGVPDGRKRQQPPRWEAQQVTELWKARHYNKQKVVLDHNIHIAHSCTNIYCVLTQVHTKVYYLTFTQTVPHTTKGFKIASLHFKQSQSGLVVCVNGAIVKKLTCAL